MIASQVNMSLPPPPADQRARDIIEKTAATVASKGPAFEDFIAKKEATNPEFAFLRGGTGADYYNLRKNIELQQGRGLANMTQQPVMVQTPAVDLEFLKNKIDEYKAQIAESQNNVNQQRLVMQRAVEQQLDSLFRESEKNKMATLIKDSGLNIAGLDKILDANSHSGSAISDGRNWILDNCVNDRQNEVVFMYLHYRVKNSPEDSPMRLQVLYIADDLAVYCRKRQPLMTSTIGRYIGKYYAYALHSHIPNILEKLHKVTKYWEKENYFDDKCMQQVKNSEGTLATERTITAAELARFKITLEHDRAKSVQSYEKQHAEYAAHAQNQINNLQSQLDAELRRLSIPPAMKPTVTYFNLPAGVCLPMIKKEDFSYKPLKIDDLRVPNVLAPTERLMSQINRFYMVMPESSLDEYGWEKDGLKPFFAAKEEAKKEMEEALKAEGRKLDDMFTNRYKSPSPEPVPVKRKSRFNDAPSDPPSKIPATKPATNQFQYSYDDDAAANVSTSTHYTDSDSPPDYSRHGLGSSTESNGRGSATSAPLFSKPIAFSFGGQR